MIDESDFRPRQLDAVRSAAKWLVTVSAALVGALAAGLPLSGISQLSWNSWRIYVALGAVLIVLSAGLAVIRSASAVLAHEWLTLAGLRGNATGFVDERVHAVPLVRRIAQRVAFSAQEIYGHEATGIGDLHRRLRQAHEAILDPATPDAERAAARERSAALREVARATVEAANYYATMALFRRMRRWLLAAVPAVVIGVAAFAYAANPPKAAEPVEVRIVNPTPTPAATGAPPR
ncbi:hypothetical protein Afil01_25090 [Actinorhabdospora filicis]|uniref:Uncharacterized protein n=1 Tax=Actinorhabdospora filicis TaxID=1785913 RepID=A0A9W6SKY1_9ACTN|nr:hypothetical protein [Actinorhabdospora filicis]GLZ77702.1 hypothetical protein Afil01_25090 [Actinorhabdospora filicis]